MDIFGIGWLEIVFILIIAILVVGPRDLGKVGRQIGRFLNHLYRSESWKMLNEASRTLRSLPNKLAREAQLEELDAIRESMEETGRLIRDEARERNPALDAWRPRPPGSPAEPPPDRTAQPSEPSPGEPP